jgi:hypothetical protein
MARKYDQQLGLAARLAGIVQTEEQAKCQENSVDSAETVELTEDRWDVLKRKDYKRLELVTVVALVVGSTSRYIKKKNLDPAVYLGLPTGEV